MTNGSQRVFTRMDAFDDEYIEQIKVAIAADAMDERVLRNLRALEDIVHGFAVDQLVHACQTATRAECAGADVDLIVGALCHDIAKTLTNQNHAAVAAEMLRPYVGPDVVWIVQVHQDFQGKHYYEHLGLDPNRREIYADHPWFDCAVEFADEWDQISFDPDYQTLPLEHFEPMVREVFGRQPTTG
jgi:predicted HD phosphohydrolase